MPRIRSVHPDICVSDTMAELNAGLERTFVRLWTHCDDKGRCEDRVKIIKAAIYPLHDDVTVEDLDAELNLLAKHQLITRYVVDGSRFIQVLGWAEYQKPQKPRPSKYPAPPVAVRDDDGSPPKKDASGVGGGVGEGVSTSPAPQDDLDFEGFWNGYPRRNGKRLEKGKALAVWKRLNKSERQRAFIGCEHYAVACENKLTLARDAFRWLRDKAFDDWQTPAEGIDSKLSPKEVTELRAAERRAISECSDCDDAGYIWDENGAAIRCTHDARRTA